jgi:hypothetical protein
MELVSNLKKELSTQQQARDHAPPRGSNDGHVMIFRAIFWIGVVSLLTPHEPDLGLGRPCAGTSLPPASMIGSAASGLSRVSLNCGSWCAGGLGMLNLFHLNTDASVTDGLADVKAQIEEDQRARAEREKQT